MSEIRTCKYGDVDKMFRASLVDFGRKGFTPFPRYS